MTRIGGLWPSIHFIVNVVTMDGITQVMCCIPDVPFAGDWDEYSNDVSVGCLWSDHELKDHLADAQQWDNALSLHDLEEHQQLIEERLNILLQEEPWKWKL